VPGNVSHVSLSARGLLRIVRARGEVNSDTALPRWSSVGTSFSGSLRQILKRSEADTRVRQDFDVVGMGVEVALRHGTGWAEGMVPEVLLAVWFGPEKA
jgi:hypothetical protein